MTRMLILACLFGAPAPLAAEQAPTPPTVIVVVGAAGEDEYGRQFHAWADRWAEAARRGGAQVERIGGDESTKDSDRARLERRLAAEPVAGDVPLWLVLVGHGTYDGKQAKYNLRGPDVSATELAQWCSAIRRPLAVIDCTSASGPFLSALAGPRRVVITATRSGHEHNFARFGASMSEAIAGVAADWDKDGQTSLLEAYLWAARRVEEVYAQDARLATEHALLDDNGDGLGTPAAWFQGLRATKRAKDGAALDGPLAHRWHLVPGEQERQLTADQRARRDALEREIAALREQKPTLAEDDYYARLEKLLVEFARLYEP